MLTEYRMKESGMVLSLQEYRDTHPNFSIPAGQVNGDDADVIIQTPAPEITATQSVHRNGIVQNADGAWEWAWQVVDFTQEQIDAAFQATVPQQVTMRQARLVLLATGKLAGVNAAIAGMTGAQGQAAQIEWEYSSAVQRHGGLIPVMGQMLGLSAHDLDNLFIAASKL